MEIRYQKISKQIWQQRDFPFYSRELKTVYFHLQTTPAGTPLGLVRGLTAALADEAHEDATIYGAMLQECEEKGLWKYDARNRVLYWLNYWNQAINRPRTIPISS